MEDEDLKPERWVWFYDLHWPKVNKATLNAAMEFVADYKPDGFGLGGDQFDNGEISHHNAKKPLYKERRSYQRNQESFEEQFLSPLEGTLGKKCEKVWIIGNHDDWEFQLVESHPELEGIVDRVEALALKERGWEVIPIGHSKRIGELSVCHGEILTGIGNQAGIYPSRKAVELYSGNVLAGHTHAPQSFSKISPVDHRKKWMGWIAPILGDVNPDYLRNRPTAWMNGFVVVEVMGNGFFNVYPIIVSDGKFSYGGKVYGR